MDGWLLEEKLRASGIWSIGTLLAEHYRSYQLIVIIGSPNTCRVTLPLGTTWNNGTFGPQCNVCNARHHRKISTTFLPALLQLPSYYGKNRSKSWKFGSRRKVPSQLYTNTSWSIYAHGHYQPQIHQSPPILSRTGSHRKQYLWDGWLSHEWWVHQDQIWKQLCTQKSSQWWTAELIKKLWNVAWDMWEHQNKALHNSMNNHKLILEKDLNDKIKQIYAIGPGQLAQADIGLMKHPLEHQLQLLLLTKQQ